MAFSSQNFLLLSGILTRLAQVRYLRFIRIVAYGEEKGTQKKKGKKKRNHDWSVNQRLCWKKSSLKFAAQKYISVVRKRWILTVDGCPREYRGMKYDYWICQKQLCHGHLLAWREIKLHEIVTIGIIWKGWSYVVLFSDGTFKNSLSWQYKL